MKADIKSIVLDLKQVKVEQVVFEAITNAIQANSTEINIHLNSINYDSEIDIADQHLIQEIKIIDNGDGFKKNEIESFQTYRSTYKKQEFGSKGVGRFLYLKLFQQVKITSLNKIINFSESNDVLVSDSQMFHAKTTLKLKHPIKGGGYPITKRDFTNKIREHFLPYFKLLNEEKKKIKLALHYNEEIGDEITSTSIPDFKTDSFIVDEHTFNISYLLNEPDYQRTDGVYCADNRVVTSNSRLDNKAQFKAFSGICFFYMLSSDYFNENLNDERDEFTIKPIQSNNNDLFKSLSWEDIHKELRKSVKSICLKHNIDLEDQANEYLNEAINEAPYLANYFDQNEFVLPNNELINQAKKKLEQDKEHLRNSSKKDTTVYKLTLKKVVQAELAEYIFDRQKIITRLQSFVDQNRLEKEIHNLFMTQHTSDDKQDYRTNNLWLFDDRFMSYDKVFSDRQIRNIFPELSDNLHKPDILSIVSNTFDGDEITDIVIIELKRPDAKNSVAIAEDELLKYSRYVNESRLSKIRIWTYAFLNFDEEILLGLGDRAYNQLPTQNSFPICYKYHETFNTIINFIDYKSLASDANTRNKTFLNILKGRNYFPTDEESYNVVELKRGKSKQVNK